MCLTIFLLDETEPLACHLHHIGQFLVYLLHFRFHASNVLLSLILVELQDTGHLDFHQPQDIITCHLSDQFGIPGLQSAAHPFHSGIHILGILKLTVLIDTLLYENLFQRGEEQTLQQFASAYEPFLPQKFQSGVHVAAKHIAHGQELRLPVIYDTAVGRNRYLTIRAGIQGIDGLVAACARSKVNQYLCLGCRKVLHVAYLYLPLLVGLEDAVNKRTGLAGGTCGLAIGYLSDGKGLAVTLLDFCAYTNHTTTLTVIILAHIDTAARREVGIEMELLAMEIRDGSIADFSQVVRKNLTVESHSYSLCSLCKQQRELHWQRDGLLVASVIRQLPFCGLGIKDHIQSEVAQSGFDITSGSSIVSCDDVAPVALTVHQQVLLSELHQGILDTGIAMRMKLHGMPHDVGHLIVPSVIHSLHTVHDASLYGLKSVTYMGNSTLQDYI